MAKPSPLVDIAQQVQAEIEHDVPVIAERLQRELVAGATKMSRMDYLGYLHRNWADPQFRQHELQRIGPKAFTSAYDDMVKELGHPLIGPAPIEPPTGG